jgi:hypothetical protein
MAAAAHSTCLPAAFRIPCTAGVHSRYWYCMDVTIMSSVTVVGLLGLLNLYQNWPCRSMGGSMSSPSGRTKGEDERCMSFVVSAPSSVSKSAHVLIPQRRSWYISSTVSGGPVISCLIDETKVGAPPRCRYSSERPSHCNSLLIQ